MEVYTEDGWRLDVQRLPAVGDPHGAALLLHPMLADRRIWDRPRGRGFASTLASEGWEVFNADYRGHGASGPAARAGGIWTYDDLVLYDTPALVRAVQAEMGGRPVVVVGHSLGGHVSMASVGLGNCHPDAMVLLSTSPWTRAFTRSRRARLLRGFGVEVYLRLTQVFGYAPAASLHIGTVDEPLPYVEDLYRHWHEGWSSRDGVDWQRALADVQCPVLAVYGRADWVLWPLRSARRWLAHTGSMALEVWEVGKGDFGLTYTPGHMPLVIDQRSRPAWLAISRWMEETCRSLP
ncbi:MAG: alpha/beta fold hydrolase [Deltaproteobacteria bacterium]|nr:alpha/beta fold hydrolase [Deltaproteobacteria bacterium]